MAAPPPTPEELARWLLYHEAGTNPTSAVLAAAAERSYGQLRARLADVFGPTGFDALWARAMYLAHGTLPPGEGDAAASTELLPPGMPAGVLDQDPGAAREALITTFAGFIALLFTFVGPPLGRGLLGQIWPALLTAAPDPQTGDTTE